MRTELNAIGCSVHGVTAAAISATDLQALRQLLYANRLIILKQQALSEQQYCDFAKAFISPAPDPQSGCRHPTHPLIAVSSNAHDESELSDGWHSDASFEKVPKVITMLMPKVLPKTHACSTLFIDMTEVCADLPRTTRDRLASVQLLHRRRRRRAGHPDLEPADAVAPPVRHPALITHPHTREKILYANRGFTIGIADSPLVESATFLKQIFDLAESSRFVKEVRWSQGDLAIWDNRFLQHACGPARGDAEPAALYRITGRDAYPLCASQISSQVAA